jgi:uncharacterized small protein (DUF1192 family)
MQSTLISREADPHDNFVVEPDVVLAARADHAPPDPISSLLTPPIHPAPEPSAPAPSREPPAGPASRAPVKDDIRIPRDIHVLGERPPRGKWAGRLTIGVLFALCSAAAAAGWDHYGDTARDTVKAVVANWTPFTLPSQPAAAAGTAAQPAAPATATDQASAQPAPAAQPAQDTTSQGSASQTTASQTTASIAAAPTPAAPDSAQSLQSMAQDVASMGQQIAALKASIEQLKAGQDQMAQQMSRDAARTPVARTSQAKPAPAAAGEQGLRARVSAALSPRPAAPRKPRPVYPPAQASAALPPAITAPSPQPAPAPLQYEPRAQAVGQADGDPVVRPPMPVR